MDDLQAILKQSIENKIPIRATYQQYARVLCPHALGYKLKKNGTRALHVLVYQSGGYTSKGPVKPGSGHNENWKCLEVGQLVGLEISDSDEWSTAGNHSISSSCIDDFIAKVDY